jgi:hypothetical protein
MANKRAIHTVAKNGRWINIREGAERGGRIFETNAKAEAAGRATAKLNEIEHVIHELDGTIRERNNYRNNPRPSTG